MLPQFHRLSRTADIERVVRTGQVLSLPELRIHYQVNEQPHHRIACVAGKRVSPKATVRHAWQRRLRYLAADYIARQTSAGPHYDMVWVAQSGLARVQSFSELERELTAVLSRLST